MLKRSPSTKRGNRLNAPVRMMKDNSWYWIDNQIVQEYIPMIKPGGFTIYNYLASHADENQCCFISQYHMAKELVMSRTSIIKSIKLLEKHGLIAIIRHTGFSQVYVLLATNHTYTESLAHNSAI